MINDYCAFGDSSTLNINWCRSYFHDIHDFERCQRLQCWWFQREQKLPHVQYCHGVTNGVMDASDAWGDAKTGRTQWTKWTTLSTATTWRTQDASRTSWSSAKRGGLILSVQPCDCWMAEIQPWGGRKIVLRSCGRADRAAVSIVSAWSISSRKREELESNNHFLLSITFFQCCTRLKSCYRLAWQTSVVVIESWNRASAFSQDEHNIHYVLVVGVISTRYATFLKCHKASQNQFTLSKRINRNSSDYCPLNALFIVRLARGRKMMDWYWIWVSCREQDERLDA